MMGCGSSMDTTSINEENVANGYLPWPSSIDQSANIVHEFVRLDEKIAQEEANCPAARLNTVEAWIEHLTESRNELIGVRPTATEDLTAVTEYDDEFKTINNAAIDNITNLPTPPIHLQMNTITQNGTETPTRDLVSLALNLGVVTDATKASTHEDFFANLSEGAIYQAKLKYYTEIIAHTRERLSILTGSQKALNELYLKHDGIIAYISGGTYMTELEQQIDAQLETAREIRDKLGAILEQWRICGTLLRASAASSTLALQQWRHLPTVIDPQQKIKAALEFRETLTASLAALECAQQALPQTELKFITNRQILAVKHCNTYMVTDIANIARYEHATRVFTSYESNINKCTDWLYETFSKTLRKDFDEAQGRVSILAQSLRDHRADIFEKARA